MDSQQSAALDDDIIEAISAINDRRLVYSQEDLKKMAEGKGCTIKFEQTNTAELDIDSDDSDNSASGKVVKVDYDPGDKVERANREYLALVINANRDYVKPESKFPGHVDQNDTLFAAGKVENKHSSILQLYGDLGNFEEKLAHNKEYVEVSPGRVYKRSINPGIGAHVTEGSLVVYNCALWTEKSKDPFDSTWLRKSTYTHYISTDSILPGLRELLMSTRDKEWAEAFIRPEAAFGALGIPPRIPRNATIFCLLEIVKVLSPDKISILALKPNAFGEIYEAADELRKRGNHYFENADYRIALQRYRSAIRILDGITYKNEQDEKKGQELLLKLYNNCARASNADGKPRQALSFCKLASLINDRVPKTYWHRMSAWDLKGHPDRALGVAQRALQLFQNEGETACRPFRENVPKLRAKISQAQTKLDETYRKMGSIYAS